MVVITKIENSRKNRKLKVGGYARVSTLKEEQIGSCDNQVSHLNKLIKTNPKWEYVEVYADYGKSGKSVKERTNFLRMIEDAKAGKLDLIICRSVSRFARNSLEAQEYAHLLKELGVEVRFEHEGFSTFDAHSELIFNFITAVAENKLKMLSESIRWVNRKRAMEGCYIGGNNVLGYDVIEGELVPNEQAWIPKLIFEEYVSGKSISEIAEILKAKNVKSLRTDKAISCSVISRVLENEAYIGDLFFYKQPPRDWKTKKPLTDYTSYYVEDAHEPIVSRETWDKAQNRLAEIKTLRSKGIYKNRHSHFLYGKLFCGECGEVMLSKTYYKKDRTVRKWICRGRKKGKYSNGCRKAIVKEEYICKNIMKQMGLKWEGIDKVTEATFENLKSAKIYDNGNIVIELKNDKMVA